MSSKTSKQKNLEETKSFKSETIEKKKKIPLEEVKTKKPKKIKTENKEVLKELLKELPKDSSKKTRTPVILKKGLNLNSIPVSTKTFIVLTNLILDIPKIWESLPVTEYILVSRKRGRKRKEEIVDPNENIPSGSIITLELGNKLRGVLLKNKKKKMGKESVPFRNSMTVVMVVDGKKINFKLTRNGKFQMTGCKTDTQAINCVKYIWSYIKDGQNYDFADEKDLGEKYFEAIFIPAMRNIDFNLGFMVNREKLDEYFNTQTDYHSLLETSIGYTGVNIKIPVTVPITDIKIKKLTYTENTGWQTIKKVPFEVYLNRLSAKEKKKKLEKERFVTFLVFNSGSTIVSAMCKLVVKDVFYKFCKIIQDNRVLFEEKLGL